MSRHCDDIADDRETPECVRAYLAVARAPAHGYGMKCPALYATIPTDMRFGRYERGDKLAGAELKAGTRVRVVMASRFGDVGITTNLEAETGYIGRLGLDDLSDFGAEP